MRTTSPSGLAAAEHAGDDRAHGPARQGGTGLSVLDSAWAADQAWLARDRELTEERAHSRRQHEESSQQQIELREGRLQQHLHGLDGKEIGELLSILAINFGAPWVDVSALIGVSVPAIRKWRLGGAASVESLNKVRHLIAFLETLRDLGIPDPMHWLRTKLAPDGFTVRTMDLYNPNNSGRLLAHARGDIPAVDLLNELLPNWRTEHATQFEVVELEDGSPAIVHRSGDG